MQRRAANCAYSPMFLFRGCKLQARSRVDGSRMLPFWSATLHSGRRLDAEAMGDSDHPDNALMRRAQAGDRGAFARLYARYASELVRKVLLPRCGDSDVAEDALAETFRTLLHAIEDYQPHPAGPWPWLSRIGASKVMDAHRASARRKRALANFGALISPLISERAASSPEESARERAELSRRVQEVLSELNPRYRTAIMLRFFDDLSRVECADKMAIQLGNFDVTLLRALRAFRTAWESRHERESAP